MATAVPVLCGLLLCVGILLGVIAVVPHTPNRESRRVAHLRVLRWARVSRRRPLLAVTAAGVVWWATGWPVAAGAAIAAVYGLPRLLAPRSDRDAIALQEALAVWTRRVGDLLASGAGGLHQALVRSADTAPDLLAAPLRRLAARLSTHGPEQALRAFAEEFADPTVDEVVLALLLRLRAGGRGVVEILHAQAAALDARAVLRREIEADRAKPRTTVRTLVGITAVMVAGLLVFSRGYLAPFDSWTGQGVLAIVVGIFALALWRMHRLSTTPRGTRYLAAGEAP